MGGLTRESHRSLAFAHFAEELPHSLKRQSRRPLPLNAAALMEALLGWFRRYAPDGGSVPLALMLWVGLHGRSCGDGLCATFVLLRRLVAQGFDGFAEDEFIRVNRLLDQQGFRGRLVSWEADELISLVSEGLAPPPSALELIVLLRLLGVDRGLPWPTVRQAAPEAARLVAGLAAVGRYREALACVAHVHYSAVPVPDTIEEYLALIRPVEEAAAPCYAVPPRAEGGHMLAGGGWRTIFVLPNDRVLGHTENLLGMLAGLKHPELPGALLSPEVLVADRPSGDGALERALDRLGIPCGFVDIGDGRRDGYAPVRLGEAICSRVRQRRADVLIWAGPPVLMAQVFSCRAAPLQIWWSMKFRHDAFPQADGYLQTRSLFPREVREGRTLWRLGPKALPLANVPVDGEEVARLRRRWQNRFPVFGVLARTAKIADPPYLEAVAEVLRRNACSVFLWTGRTEAPDPSILQFFADRGLSEQQDYIGWVDTDLFVRVIDIYLDNFTLSGVTTIRALAAGTPVVEHIGAEGPLASFADSILRDAQAPRHEGEESVVRIFSGLEGLGSGIAAVDGDDYIRRACVLAKDPPLRRAFGEACRNFAQHWLLDPWHAAREFTGNVSGIAREKGFFPPYPGDSRPEG